MEVDATKTQFSTTYVVDKVAMYSTVADGQGYNPGGTLAVGAASLLPFSTIYYATVPNPYGRKCLPTLSWSLDGKSYYPMNTPVFYYNPTYMSYMWQALTYAGCSDSTLYLACTTQYNAAQTIYLQFALDSPT